MTSSVKRISRRVDMLKKMLSPPQAVRKKEKQSRPKGYMARRAGAAAFWVLFSFMFLTVAVTLFSKTEKPYTPKATTVEAVENPAVKPEAVQFAKSFTTHYFNWGNSEEEKKKRQEKLKAFLAEGLDPQAGLNMEKVTWNSVYKSSAVKQVKERGSNKSLITFYVSAEFSRETKDEDEPETKNVSKYFVVPVAYDGHSYGVYELPKFTYMKEQTTVKAEETGLQKASSSPETSAVRRFLDTFFKSYTEDSTDKLAYILEDGTRIAGLNKSMTFVKVASADIYEGKKKGEYSVQSEVIMQDPESDMQFHTDYELAVKKEGGRFVVSAMNESEGDEQ
ncbi:conjugal transfer protein [Domibacillus indicus]|uniref:conjugal transfer protein n=1 Tax=Domibacillus indicus TaxID=1437523 RepID=UPI000617FA1E|nr:conjugal transfer protein [Domibacillus indicus]